MVADARLSTSRCPHRSRAHRRRPRHRRRPPGEGPIGRARVRADGAGPRRSRGGRRQRCRFIGVSHAVPRADCRGARSCRSSSRTSASASRIRPCGGDDVCPWDAREHAFGLDRRRRTPTPARPTARGPELRPPPRPSPPPRHDRGWRRTPRPQAGPAAASGRAGYLLLLPGVAVAAASSSSCRSYTLFATSLCRPGPERHFRGYELRASLGNYVDALSEYWRRSSSARSSYAGAGHRASRSSSPTRWPTRSPSRPAGGGT